MGTESRPPTPKKKIKRRSKPENWCTSATAFSSLCSALPSVPCRWYCNSKAGTTIAAKLAKKISFITPTAVTEPLIQSIIVVTSPMGEKAPPALAAITMRPA